MSAHDKQLKELIYLFKEYIQNTNEFKNSHRYKIGDKVVNLLRTLTLKGAKENYVLSEMFNNEKTFTNFLKKVISFDIDFFHTLTTDFESFFQKHSIPTSTIDIIIPIHNALEDVKNCVESVLKSQGFNQLILVNDGSDQDMIDYLEQVKSKYNSIELIHHQEAIGYTKSVNEGYRLSEAELIVNLNSDTIVPNGWLSIINKAADQFPETGVFGPFSNAASYQSVPEIKDNGDWAINKLPAGLSVDDTSALIYLNSKKSFPITTFLNGFCFIVRKSVLDTVGLLDEEAFPKGYGEENDLCIRVREAGHQLRVLDNLYVFHAKSKSFGHVQRQELAKHGSKALVEKHGEYVLKKASKALATNKELIETRQHIKNVFYHFTKGKNIAKTKLTFAPAFLLPVKGGSGGAHSVVQEAMGMRKIGVSVHVLTLEKNQPKYEQDYGDVILKFPDLFLYYKNDNDLQSLVAESNITTLIATIFTSVKTVKLICDNNPKVNPAYYIQDYEPMFYEEGDDYKVEAAASYELIPNATLFAKTKWIIDTVEKHHKVKVHKVSPSIDHEVYFPLLKDATEKVTISAMIRPQTPRRGAKRTMEVLKDLKAQFNTKIEIKIFGCDALLMDDHKLPQDFEFENRGVLTRNKVAELLRLSDVFIDLSDYQAFGRTGLEAMACHCIPILPQEGGVYEYATDENSIIVDSFNTKEAIDKISTLITDNSLRTEIQDRTINTALNFDIARAAWSEVQLLKNKEI
jgi:GT2 family glycosyltransferase/glycosyltransferase involved in cell wall biosynthesis